MKIGIISSGNDNLTLFNFLNKYTHTYHIYYDQNNWPHGDKDFDYSLKLIEQAVEYFKNIGVEKIILAPVYELYFLQNKQYVDKIIPLFREYLLKNVFSNSLIGKIGFLGDYVDIQVSQNLIYNLSKNYKLTENQSNIKKFHFPFKFWFKEVGMWKYFATNLSFSSLMVNKVIKFALRYFKDANVDSIVPMNYVYFNYQNTIFKFFNFKKQRFHKLNHLESIFDNFDFIQDLKYSINIHHNGHKDFLIREKKWVWLLQKGKSCEIEFVKL